MLLVPPPLVAVGAAVAQRRLPSSPRSVGRGVVAAALTLASAGLANGAGREFRRQRTTLEPQHPEKASALVTTGSNAVTRNPMYVGLAGVLVAHAVWRGSVTALLPAAAFVAYLDRVQIAAEEAALVAKFGADYEAYRAAVPRWLGPGQLRRPSGG